MKRDIYILILILICFKITIVAQHQIFCGSDQYEEILLQNPDYQSQIQKEEKAYRANSRKPKIQKRNIEVTIPIVFHVIHNNGPENISDAQVLQGLDHLNQAFANEGVYQNEMGVDTKIRFCLAQRDEDGNGFSGITRHESIYTDMSNTGALTEIRKISSFDNDKYFNIYIVKNCCIGGDCNVAGMGGAFTVVVQADNIGTSARNDIVITHEMGHALNLAHTWKGGCKNDNCLKDGDKVCDTPPDNRTYEHCFTPSNSCTSDEDDTSTNNPFRPLALGGVGDQDDDHTNFMDYNWWDCAQHFTQGQADRMHFFIQDRYASLLSSNVCLPPCGDLVISDFDLPDSIAIGVNLTILNQSINADSYQWFVNGNPVSTTLDYTHTFLDIGTITVQLEAYTNDTLCETSTMVKPIIVYCPVKACFDYTINGQYLILDDCSTNATTLEFIVINDKDTIYTTAESLDSVYVNNIDFVRVCLTARGEHCSDVHCEYITITSNGSEICGNEQDDDGDGLIDLFDPDCPCQDDAYQAQCPTDCEIIPDSFPDIKMKMKWESEVISELRFSTSSFSVGYLNQTNNVTIISPFHRGGIGSSQNYIATFRADNGLLQDTFRILADYKFFELATYTAVVKDKFSDQYFIYGLARDTLICINQSGVEIFKKGYDFKGRTIGIADFNGDGLHEVYIDKIILNGITGAVLIDESSYCDDFCFNNISVAADVLGGDGRPELISGKYVFDVSILNTLDSVGNSVVVTQAPSGVSDGKCSIADIDGDGNLEIIVVQSNEGVSGLIGNLSIWDPRNQILLAQVPNPILGTNNFDGSIPFVGDVDGDCIPEIGVVYNLKFTLYKYINNNLEELYSVSTSDRSGITGITMFDFNQDGRQELIYRDETHLRIFNGATGETIDSTQMYSGTFWEYPIVADVDNDGQAEIIVSGSLTGQDEVRMYCFESASTPWAPARSVWNQYAYNPTQVNDDLTIPRYQQNAAQPLQGTENCPRETCNTPYNNFMVQATYRTQEGCFVWPELQRDLTISAESRCVGDSLEICFFATSTDTTTISQGVEVSCYPPPWDNGAGNPIDIVTITQDTTCIMMPMLIDIDSLLIVINDAGGYYPPDFPNTSITECDYTNNAFVLQLGGPDFSIDIIDWECSPDSLIFYIATDNVGLDTDVSCIGGGCYFIDPSGIGVDPQQSLLEVTTWCFDFDTTTMTYQYQDTFRVTIPHPNGQSQMWWTINEGGFGPGVMSSELTGIYECNYTNNTAYIAFDIGTQLLNLGPDIIKCNTEVITLDAGGDYVSYLWNDLTTDSLYSSSFAGLHYVEAMDACGRVYRDTVAFILDNFPLVDLGDDRMLCADESLYIDLGSGYDQINWLPSEIVDCNTCAAVNVTVESMTQLVVRVISNNCVAYDTIMVDHMPQVSLDIEEQICQGETFSYQDSVYTLSGDYTYAINDCDSIAHIHLTIVDEIMQFDTLHICEGDSIQVFGQWWSEAVSLNEQYNSVSGCDSLQTYSIMIDAIPLGNKEEYICQGDSINVYDQWYAGEGIHELYIANSTGCDSLIQLHIVEYLSVNTYDTITICEGDTLFIEDWQISETMDISQIFTTEESCDSTVNLHVKAISNSSSMEEVVLCPGDSIWINGEWVKENTIVVEVIASVQNCDSTHTTEIIFIDAIDPPTANIDCDNNEIIASIDAPMPWQILWDNGDTTTQTIYFDKTEALISLYAEPNCQQQFTLVLPSLPNIGQSTLPTDTLIVDGQNIHIDLGLNPLEWTVYWSPSELVSCDICMDVEINAVSDVQMSIYLVHESGCVFDASFNIMLQDEASTIYIPNVFSPNNDGQNDYWKIFNADNVHIQECQIYDRWGNLIYYTEENQIEWHGEFKGQFCEQGVYVYLIKYTDVDGSTKIQTGDITLLR